MQRFEVIRAFACAVTILLAVSTVPTIAQTVPGKTQTPQLFGYALLDRIAQPRENFVQGLQIFDDILYVGTGMYGESKLREYTFPGMQLEREATLPPTLFGEGVTRLNGKIYQLTWRAGIILVYDADSLEQINQHRIDTQGWGITHNGKDLIYSDGSDQLFWLDADTLAPHRSQKVTLNGKPLSRLNELEWINDEIWANVWGANQLVRIDPGSGAVTGIVDLRGLLPDSERQANTDVLNGIAWDANSDALWVTGKRWPWLYRIRVVLRPRDT